MQFRKGQKSLIDQLFDLYIVIARQTLQWHCKVKRDIE